MSCLRLIQVIAQNPTTTCCRHHFSPANILLRKLLRELVADVGDSLTVRTSRGRSLFSWIIVNYRMGIKWLDWKLLSRLWKKLAIFLHNLMRWSSISAIFSAYWQAHEQLLILGNAPYHQPVSESDDLQLDWLQLVTSQSYYCFVPNLKNYLFIYCCVSLFICI